MVMVLYRNGTFFYTESPSTPKIFEGPVPCVITTDLELLKEVFIKRFSSFHGRKFFPVQPDPDDAHGISMVTAEGPRWKRLRMITNPTFSVSKMKQMSPLINEAVTSFLKTCEEKAKEGKPFDIYKEYQGLTMEVIASCAFGLQINTIHDKEHPFLVAGRDFFNKLGKDSMKFYMMIPAIFPILRRLFYAMLYMAQCYMPNEPSGRLRKFARETIQLRKSDPKYRRMDLLQLMIDATLAGNKDQVSRSNSSENGELSFGGAKEQEGTNGIAGVDGEMNGVQGTAGDVANGTGNVKTSPQKSGLSKEEIVEQCLVFIIAGYETTSTALGYCSHELALNPEVQKRLQAEIDEQLGDEDHINYETIQKLPYLEMVFCEALRLHPIATTFINRRCMEPCTVNGLHIPAGLSVQADVLSIHADPEVWGPTDPSVFEPERFSPENKATRHPMAWLPFGAGPRNCVGMRFAILEAKIALARVLKHFTIERCAETEVPLKKVERATTVPMNGVTVKLVKREI
ncbi:cytochrome P450 3A29-like [Lingula anatina]|uniref:Cytochrome P450 3A29-like n=1 Tax=Lingula anatina TaxID=7574 RepID=A0A2R2MS99_LINAN|nr:cytochrome P450 3A29-like [Lingula anatina]|eukprot:XP_023933140.1 cytochrome P450 3A29-like [Lingula anatina]